MKSTLIRKIANSLNFIGIVLGLVLISFAKPLLGLLLSIILMALLIWLRSQRPTNEPFKDFHMTKTKQKNE